jgi:CBS domain-containing protein
MQAHDIMTKDVVLVRPDTPVRDIATLMIENRISGLPVVAADGQVVGIVSQSDLLHRHELQTETKQKWWLKVFSDPDRIARAFSKAHGLKARDVMSRHVVSVDENNDLADVAALLDRNRIKRVPVVRNGKLVGLIARSDLVKALVKVPARTGAAHVDAATLHRMIGDKIRGQTWLNTSYLNVIVENGTVQLWGFVASEDQRRALRVLVEETEGVNAVDDHLSVGYPAFAGAL